MYQARISDIVSKHHHKRLNQQYLAAVKKKKTKKTYKLDLAFNNVKPKDWYFVLD